MPLGIMISRSEAEAAEAAGVGTLRGNFFEYDPRETMAMIDKVTATGLDGAGRLVTRLADLYGKHLVRSTGKEVAPSPAPPRAKRGTRVYVDREEEI